MNGVAFADNDSAWRFQFSERHAFCGDHAFPSLPSASPAIVPSGVYATDGNANVYAFALP
ncbi:MAG: hypothetical protein DLM50_08825 [Candidatus Meridianibacter frigidus]|nr:MAG: hypothetical protein DLM50_08825 [Candidatus Eremiobacteraeota bacterium]